MQSCQYTIHAWLISFLWNIIFLHLVKEYVVYTHEHFWCKRCISLYCAPVVLYVYVLCTTLPVYCACVAHFFSTEYDLFCIWLQNMLATHMSISVAKYALLCTKHSNSLTGMYLKPSMESYQSYLQYRVLTH